MTWYGEAPARPSFPIQSSNSQDGLNTVVASASEAIHLAAQRKSGLLRRGACHRASIRATRWLLAMTSLYFRIRLRDLATRCARVVQNPLPSKIRGRRESRVPVAPAASCAKVESTRVSHHRFTGTPGLPCAMVLTAYFALSPVTGLVCHRRPQEACFSRT